MNLHGVVANNISAVNPFIMVKAHISAGETTNPDGTQTPLYETPSTIIGSIAGTVLTVAAVSQGRLGIGQRLWDRSGALLPGTTLTGFLTGNGHTGTYSVDQPQTVPEEAMGTSLTLLAQVQPLTFWDIKQLDGLNLQGVRWKAYLYGQVDGLVRAEKKGGDLIKIRKPSRHAGQWLVGQVLEQWPDWVCAAITFQNDNEDDDD